MKSHINKYFSSINKSIKVNFKKNKYRLSIKGECITNKELYTIINNQNLLAMQINENIQRNVDVKSQAEHFMKLNDLDSIYEKEKLSRSQSPNKEFEFDLIRGNKYIPLNDSKVDDFDSEIRIVDYNFNLDSLKDRKINLRSLEYTPAYVDFIESLSKNNNMSISNKFYSKSNATKSLKLNKNMTEILDKLKIMNNNDNILPYSFSSIINNDFPELIFSKDNTDFTKIFRKNVNNLYNIRSKNNSDPNMFLPIIIENESNQNNNLLLNSFTTIKKLCQFHRLDKLHGVITNLNTWRFIMYVNNKDTVESEENFHISNKLFLGQGLSKSKIDIINNTLELLL